MAFAAGITMAAGVHHATHTDPVAYLEFVDLTADGHHPADDFMARHYGIAGSAPVIVGGVQIRMADAAAESVDLHIIGAWPSASDGMACQWCRGRCGSMSVD